MPSFTPDPTLPANTEAIGGGLGASRIRNITTWLLNAFGYTGATSQTFVNSPFGVDGSNLITVQANPSSALGIATKQYVDIASTPIANPITNGGSGHAFTGTLAPAITAYSTGAEYRVLWTQSSQGNDTIALNGLSAITVKKQQGGALVNLSASDVPAGAVTDIVYDGTNFQLIGIVGTGSTAVLVAGTPPAWTGTLVPGILAYANLQQYRVQFPTASAGSDTIALNGLAAKTVKKNVNGTQTNLAAGDIPANGIIDIVYDSTGDVFQIVSAPLPAALPFAQIYDRSVGNPAVAISSSAAETTLYTKSVAGNTLGTDGAFRITFVGRLFNNTAATKSIDIKVKFGGTTVLDSGSAINPADGGGASNFYTLRGVIYIGNLGATNLQYANGLISLGGATTNGLMVNESTGNGAIGEYTGLSVDTTTAQTLAITATLSASSASLTFNMYECYVELLQHS